MSACVQGFVGELSDSYRAVLMLHDVHGLTCPEIAAALGDSTGAVKIRCTGRARRCEAACRPRARSRMTNAARLSASPTTSSPPPAYPFDPLGRLIDDDRK